MPYTNGIFHIDPISGSDTARANLTGCVASNPSGTITRINKTGHGLTTGAVVDLTLFTTWLNSAWKITVVDADNFDLDDAVWQATADPNGTVSPRGGSSWADAWLTVASGASNSRIQPGDEIRFPVTPEVGTGVNATFTDGSKVVTLASALTKTIQHADAIADWTVSTNITGSNNNARKYGANAATFTPATAFTTGPVAYALVDGGGTQDFSAYTKISFWFRRLSATALAANTLRIRLCSDAAGTTTVNSLVLTEATLNTTAYQAFVLDNGAPLGNNIQSIAIDCLIDPGTVGFSLNNIVACNDVTHNSIIGPENDCMYCVQSFDDTTIAVDTNNVSAAGKGWSGTAGTYELHYISPYVSNSSGSLIAPSESGDYTASTTYAGGYDTGTNLVTGRTAFLSAGFGGTALATSGRDYTSFRNLGFFRLFNPFSGGNYLQIHNCVFSNSSSNGTIGAQVLISNSFFLNGVSTQVSFAQTSGAGVIEYCVFANNAASSLTLARQTAVFHSVFRNNNSAITFAAGACGLGRKGARLYKCLVSDTTEFLGASTEIGVLWSYEHDQTAGNHWGFTDGGTINWQTAEKQGSDPGAWRVVHSSATRPASYPIRFDAAQIAVTASSMATVTAWVKKDHATDVGCRIFVEDEDYTLTGIVADSDTAADSTAWQQITITFTPSVSGVVPIWFESFYIAGNSNTYLGSIKVTQ